jgi:hypothetical protein
MVCMEDFQPADFAAVIEAVIRSWAIGLLRRG